MNTIHSKLQKGFTLVELLIVIVIIGILVAISVVAYNGITGKAQSARRDSDMSQLLKAITIARNNTDQTLGEITKDFWSMGKCISVVDNPEGIEPKDLPKTHVCWAKYYLNLDRISDASGIDLQSLRAGDPRGNPYVWDESEGESGDYCRKDGKISYFSGDGVSLIGVVQVPKYYSTC